MATPPPPNLPFVPDPVSKPAPLARPGEGFDIPDPFEPPKSTLPKSKIVATPVPDAASEGASTFAKASVDKTASKPASASVPAATAAAPASTAGRPAAFQQPSAPERNTGKQVFLIIGIFIAVALLTAGIFIAYRLLAVPAADVTPTPFPTTLFSPEFAPSLEPTAPLFPSLPDRQAGTTPTPVVFQDSSDTADPDSDGLTNAEERFYSTDPTKADSDADGYKDSEEVRNGYNPLGLGKMDSDDDGFPDPDERKFGTDPFNPDTDGDGYKDGEEIDHNHNPLIPAPNDTL